MALQVLPATIGFKGAVWVWTAVWAESLWVGVLVDSVFEEIVRLT